jgi:hypothetical protein
MLDVERAVGAEMASRWSRVQQRGDDDSGQQNDQEQSGGDDQQEIHSSAVDG